jgi:hypothetical protein
MEFTGHKPTGISRQSKSLTERRQSARLVVHSPAYANLNGSSSEKARDLSEILDISQDGISVQTSTPLEIGHDLNLGLDLSETKTRINTAGRVIWSDSSGRAGIRFLKLADRSMRQLKEWLFVNVLTAFDHSRERSNSEDEESGAFGSPLLLNTTSRGQIDGPSDVQPSRAGESSAENVPAHDNVAEPGFYSGPPRSEKQSPVDLQSIAEEALALTRATGAAIALSAGDQMICQASAGGDAPPVGARLQASSGFSGTCIRTGRSLRCDDSEMDDRVDRESCRALGIRSIVAVPIRSGSQVAGLIEVFSPQPYAFNAKDISVLQELTMAILPARVTDAPAHTPLHDTQRMPVRRLPVGTSDLRHVEEQPATGFLAETMNAGPSSRSSLHKIILAFAAVTFVFALVWLIAPALTGRTAASKPLAQNIHQPGSGAVSKPVSMPDKVTDLASLRHVAEQGDPAAQFALGARYATGEDVPQDYTQAVHWFSLAADQGHILAQATLGAYYWAGRGVPPDLTKAYFWSALAQAGGDQASKYRVAVLTSRMSRNDILTAQQQANDWLRNHQTAGNAAASR